MRHSREEIQQLLNRLDKEKARDLESETLEFKEWEREWTSNSKKLYKALAEHAVCFANQKGGTIVLGVRDNVVGREKAILGCSSFNIYEIRSRIYEATDPKILVAIEELFIEDLGARLLLIHIPQGLGISTTTDGTAKIRIGTDCKPLTGSMRYQRLIEVGLLDVTGQSIPGLSQEALEPREIDRLKQLIRVQAHNSPLLTLQESELLEQTGITQNSNPTLAGLLLAGREDLLCQYVPSHEVEYLRMKDDIEYERRETYTCGLLRTLEEVYRNIELYNRITTIQTGLFHYEIKDFPEATYREAILNAVLHRDYSSSGVVFIKHYQDRLEISNPGGFLAGITPENILRQDSIPRNRLLAEILRKIGLIEKAGMGVKRMFYHQLALGKMPPIYQADEHMVRLTLQNGSLDESFVYWVKQQEKEGCPLSLDELLVLSVLRRQRELALPEAAILLQLDRERTREILMRMVRQGLLEKSGIRKGMIFRLSGILYRELGESIAYIRERGIDTLRYEEMILNYVRQYGSITNHHVRELLGVDIYQASRLLRKLTSEGKLRKEGSYKDSVYVLA